MKRLMFAAAALAVLCVAQQAAGQEQRPARRPALPLAGVITKPDWLTKPSGDDFARDYPPIAMMMGLEGQSSIKCKVNEAGALEACTVISEQPAGIGFGQAAIQMSGLFRMKPQTVDGAPVGGAEVSIPIHFAMGQENLPPTPAVVGPPPSDKALALGRRLVDALGVGQQLAANTAQQIQQLKAREFAASSGADASAQDPALQALADAFQDKQSLILDRIAAAYARQFSEEELNQLAVHFESPAQKLWLAKQAALGQAFASAYAGSYVEIIADARRRFCQTTTCLGAASAAVAQGAKP
jgi:TonB family protein